MRRLQRPALSPKASSFLRQRTAKVTVAANPQVEAKRLWQQKSNKAFQEVRAALGRMASGLERCMYCEDSQGTAIDHFWPQALYPQRAFDWDNYLLACSHCNSNQKRDQFPLDPAGLPQLIEPCLEDPLTHLSFSTSTGRYEPRQGSAKGTASIQVFGLNRPVLCDGRCDAWVALGQLLACYADSRAQGNDGLASKIEKLVRRHPFAGVLAALLQIAAGPEPDLFLEPATLKAIQTYPEILTWN